MLYQLNIYNSVEFDNYIQLCTESIRIYPFLKLNAEDFENILSIFTGIIQEFRKDIEIVPQQLI